ncbi:MAG: hypothetical protein A2355_01185 [Spirochaetes bacterium RIFOXYB1_FULL_32_8]|nr:MAG: hypothetical protein A2355_01185 [Spirochaetes bacterium RIFOXYB1_FULL_32_8]
MKILQIICLCLVCSGCLTVKEVIKSDEKFSSTESVYTLKIVSNSDGTLRGIIKSPFLICAEISGVIKKTELTTDVHIDTIHYLTSWANGWTEGIFDATGIISFYNENGKNIVSIKEEITIFDLKKGNLRYYDTMYQNEDGYKKVQDRFTRIKAIIEYLKTNGYTKPYGKVYFKSEYSNAFLYDVKKSLLAKNVKLPENLQRLKDSGTLEKDIQEAVELIFTLYNSDNKIILLKNH